MPVQLCVHKLFQRLPYLFCVTEEHVGVVLSELSDPISGHDAKPGLNPELKPRGQHVLPMNHKTTPRSQTTDYSSHAEPITFHDAGLEAHFEALHILALLVEDRIVQGRIAHSQGALYDNAFLGQPDAFTACVSARKKQPPQRAKRR